jgi:hypothetical protein
MKTAKLSTLVLAAFLITALPASAASEPIYDMNQISTTLWDRDVDYFSPPIKLIRSWKTHDLHRVEFNVLDYVAYCVFWEQVCVAWNAQGRCVAYERRCARWDTQEIQVEKRIELNFRSLPDLAVGQEETYRIHIDRQRPFRQGEDRVSTFFEGVNTVVPVKVLKLNDFSYRIDPQ